MAEDNLRLLGSELAGRIKQRMGEEFWRERPEVVMRAPDGTVLLCSLELAFFEDPRLGLIAIRRLEDGRNEFGGVDGDGVIQWGYAILHEWNFPAAGGE